MNGPLSRWTRSFRCASFSSLSPLAKSVAQDYLPERFPNASNVEISIIGTSALALEYCSLIVLLNFYRRYPELILPFTYGALVVCVIALIAASFATSIGTLIFCQGIMYSLGGSGYSCPDVRFLGSSELR